MAPKKSTEKTATPVATHVAAPVVASEKQKKSKKSEQPATTSTPAVPVVSSTSPAPAPVSEKPKKSKKSEQPSAVSSSVVSEQQETTSVPVAEKPKKASKNKSQTESSPVVESTETTSSTEEVRESSSEKPKKRASKKKTNSLETETSSETSGETPVTSAETSEVPEKRVRKMVNQETLKSDVEQLKQQVESEIQRLRTDQQKNKGVKFLKVVNKYLKTLAGDLNRVLKSKTKTTRNKNTSSGFMKPVKISSEMALFTNWDHSSLYSRVDVTKFLCSYIKSNSLQNPEDRRQILCDEKLASLLKVDTSSETPLTYPGLQQHIQQHFISDVSSVSEEVVHP
jgi:upstream activation factor subunit UAF30